MRACSHRRTKAAWRPLKRHPKESYNDVIGRLLDMAVDDEPLSEEAIRGIEEALESVRAGRLYSEDETQKESGGGMTSTIPCTPGPGGISGNSRPNSDRSLLDVGGKTRNNFRTDGVGQRHLWRERVPRPGSLANPYIPRSTRSIQEGD